jgi:Prealbumin-like fold domain
MLLQRFSLTVFLSFAGFCFAQTPSPLTTPEKMNTGIDGVLTIAPTHPGPVRPGVASSKPLANATFVISNQSGSTTEFATDEQGHFKVSLEPGQYTITRKGAQSKIGRCGPFEARVAAGQMTHVEWQCDSGMR